MRPVCLSALWLILSTTLVAQDAAAPPKEAKQEEIARLLKELDADEFETREKATEALIAIGEPAEKELRKRLEETQSVEVKERASRVLKSIERERLQRNALKLDVVYRMARDIVDGKAKATDLDPVLEKIVEHLAKSSKREGLKVPVKAASCAARPAAGIQQFTLYVGDDNGNPGHLRDSFMVLDMGAHVSHAQNSVIVAWGVADVSSAQNCIIIAGADVSVSHAQDCIILAGGRVDISHGTKTIVGGGEAIRSSFLRDNSFVVNSKYEPRAVGSEAATVVDVPGLVLRDKPLMSRLLDDKLEVSYLSSAFMLVKVPGENGEHVVRSGSELRDAYDKPLLGVEGWKLMRSSSRFALLQKEDERTYLRMERN